MLKGSIDRHMILEHLVLAERHMAEGEAHIKRQKKIIEELAEGAHNTDQAVEVLTMLEDMQRQLVWTVNRVREELARSEF